MGEEISKKPFAGLLKDLNSALSSIDKKTKTFQIDYPGEAEKTSMSGSEFENELRKLVELANYIDSKLPF